MYSNKTFIDLRFHILNIQPENYFVAEYRNLYIEYTVKYTLLLPVYLQ